MRKYASTIAEMAVVIVVFSFLAITSFMVLKSNEATNKAYEKAGKAAYFQLERATRLVLANNTNGYTLMRMKDASGEFSIASSSSLNRMVEVYKKNMIIHRTAVQAPDYFVSELTDGTTLYTGLTPSSFAGFTVRNDAYVGIKLNGNCTSTINYIYDALALNKRVVENVCATIFYDVNGDKGPNRLGSDQYIFPLDKFGLK